MGVRSAFKKFLHVDDLAASIMFIIENKINNDLINIGSGQEVTILDLAKKLKKLLILMVN